MAMPEAGFTGVGLGNVFPDSGNRTPLGRFETGIGQKHETGLSLATVWP
jgi:hypothetical protein